MLRPMKTLAVKMSVALAVVGSLVGVGQGSAFPDVVNPGSWIPVGRLSVARFDHISTLMSNGSVLVSGGRTTVALASAEVISPVTMRSTPTGSMATPRWRHTATALPNGKVLVAGGFTSPYGPGANAQPVTDTAELYDPATGTFTPTGSLNTRRALATAILLDNGKVLVAGGRGCNAAPPTACNFTFRLSSAELYDPATGTWTPTGSMTSDRHTTASARLPDGRILVPAGFTSAGNGFNGDVYDPATGTWSATSNLNESRARQGAALLPDGRVLVTAGFPGRATSEAYDAAANTWTLTGNVLEAGRFNYSYATLPNGYVLMGGGIVSGSPRKTSELFLAGAGWSAGPTIPSEHGSGSSLANSDPAIVLSGSPTSYVFDPNKCINKCGAALLIGNNPTGAIDMYIPGCTATYNTQKYACYGAI